MKTARINGINLAVDQYNMLTEIKEMCQFPFEIFENEMYLDYLGINKCSGFIHRFESDNKDFNCVMSDDNGGLFLCDWYIQKSNNEI